MCGKGLFVQTDPGQGRLPVGGFSGVERHLERGPEQGLRRSAPGQHRSIIQRWSRHRYSCAPVSRERWGGMEVLHAGFGFQGASTHTRSTVESKTFPSSRQDLSLRTPFPSLHPPSRPRDLSHPSCEQRKPLARLEGFGLSMLCSPSGSNCLCFRVG